MQLALWQRCERFGIAASPAKAGVSRQAQTMKPSRPSARTELSSAGGEGPQSARDSSRGGGAGPGLPRRRLLLAGAGVMSTAGLGAVTWKNSRPPASRPRTVATRQAPAQRAAIWRAKLSVPRSRVMAASGGVVCIAGDMGVYSQATSPRPWDSVPDYPASATNSDSMAVVIAQAPLLKYITATAPTDRAPEKRLSTWETAFESVDGMPVSAIMNG